MSSPAKPLAEAKNAAGDRAVSAAARGDHARSRKWQALAVEIDELLRKTISLMAD